MDIKDRVLIVEDDKSIRNFLRTVLEANNFDVITAVTGAEAYSMATSQCPDLVILDLGLPDMDGMKILKGIREWSAMPILVVSARSHERDKVEALDAGADDYITKPFNPVEVQARVKSQLRRYMQLGGGNMTKKNLAIGGIELDDSAKVVTLDGDAVSLTPTEYDILKLFMEQPGVVFSPKDIYRKVWKDAPFGSESTVAVHIRHLREKLEYDPANPRYLKVVWGQGYKMERGNTP